MANKLEKFSSYYMAEYIYREIFAHSNQPEQLNHIYHTREPYRDQNYIIIYLVVDWGHHEPEPHLSPFHQNEARLLLFFLQVAILLIL
jgi:hypothetical protein